jgi:hypothetical protein
MPRAMSSSAIRDGQVLHRVAALLAGDLRGGGERGGEDRQPGEHPLRGRGQQVIAPLDGAGQRLLPAGQVGQGARALQRPGQPGQDLLRGQQPDRGGGEFQGQRQAVQPAA